MAEDNKKELKKEDVKEVFTRVLNKLKSGKKK